MWHQGRTGFLVLEKKDAHRALLSRCHEEESEIQYESMLGALHGNSNISTGAYCQRRAFECP